MIFQNIFFISAIAPSIVFASLNSANAVSPTITTYLNNESHLITEDGQLPASNLPETLDFVRAVVADWRQTLQALPSIAPDTRRQTLLIVSGEFLPPKDYVAFIDDLCELRSRNKLTSESLRSILWAEMPKAGFLAFNFDQPEVSAVVAKLEALVTRDFPNDWRDFFAELKSGKMKEHVIDRRNREGGRLPESFATSESEPYQQLMGGSVKADMKLLAKSPIEAVTSLASTNRSRWSMIVAVILMLGAIVALVAIMLRIRRRVKR